MSAAAAFLKANPVLIPLITVVTAGVGGGLVFGGYYLTSNQDVVINRSKYPQPWNDFPQHKNSKLFSWNQDIWKSRVGIPDPRMAYLANDDAIPEDKRSSHAKAYIQRARALQGDETAK